MEWDKEGGSYVDYDARFQPWYLSFSLLIFISFNTKRTTKKVCERNNGAEDGISFDRELSQCAKRMGCLATRRY